MSDDDKRRPLPLLRSETEPERSRVRRGSSAESPFPKHSRSPAQSLLAGGTHTSESTMRSMLGSF